MNNFYVFEIKYNFSSLLADHYKIMNRVPIIFFKNYKQIRSFPQIMNKLSFCKYLLESSFFKDFNSKKNARKLMDAFFASLTYVNFCRFSYPLKRIPTAIQPCYTLYLPKSSGDKLAR
jgi:hypothetical protein